MRKQYKSVIIILSFIFSFYACQSNKKENPILSNDTIIKKINDSSHNSIVMNKTTNVDSLKNGNESKKERPTILNERSFLNNKIVLKIPVYFEQMDENLIELKYPRLNPKTANVFSNEQGDISIILEIKENTLNQMMLESLKKDFTEKFSNTRGIQLESTLIKKINNKNILIVEFISQAYDTQIYNHMFITDIEGKTFMGTINYPVSVENEWKKNALSIINSFKEKK